MGEQLLTCGQSVAKSTLLGATRSNSFAICSTSSVKSSCLLNRYGADILTQAFPVCSNLTREPKPSRLYGSGDDVLDDNPGEPI